MKTRTMTLAALFAALIAVFSQIAIPLPGLVPINLAPLAVFLAGALLGAQWGAISVIVFVLLGFMGVPVFSGLRAGPGVLLGPTGGYLLGFIVTAVLVGLLLRLRPVKWMLPVSMFVGLAVCYALGTAWYMYATQTALLPALFGCVLPFLPGDALKILAATLVARRVGILRYAPTARRNM